MSKDFESFMLFYIESKEQDIDTEYQNMKRITFILLSSLH